MRHRRAVTLLTAAALMLAACSASDPETAQFPALPDGTDAPGSGDAPDGERVPGMPVEHFDGSTVTLDDFADTPMVVNFWASWCPPCLAEMPDFEAVSQLAGDRVTFVGVNTQDSPARAAGMAEQTGITYDLVRDPDAALSNAFGVFGMPATYYVDARGIIVGRHIGLLTRDALIADLRDHLGVEVDIASG
jgi:cytochrome c biogenesis protein CcmG, thiol:disulfide interchange protein DsbE